MSNYPNYLEGFRIVRLQGYRRIYAGFASSPQSNAYQRLASPTMLDSRRQLQIRLHRLTRFLTLPYQPSQVDIHSSMAGTRAYYTRKHSAGAMPMLYRPLQLLQPMHYKFFPKLGIGIPLPNDPLGMFLKQDTSLHAQHPTSGQLFM